MEIRENEVYTHEETQQILKVSSSTVTRMIKKGLIRTAKVGKQYRILGKELLRILSPELEDKVGQVYSRARRWVHDEAQPEKRTLTAIVQARMSSSRLPGKVLKEAQGKPLLGYLISRLKQSKKLKDIVIATSDDPTDNAIADFARDKKIQCYRGSLDNVAQRFSQVIQKYRLPAFVRVSADSPLMDFRLLDKMIRLFDEGHFKIVTNTLRRTFPKGQSIEILDSKLFLEHYPKMNRDGDFEHVTPYFYRNTGLSAIHNHECAEGDFSHKNLCVDTQEDYDRWVRMLGRMVKSAKEYTWLECLKLQDEVAKEKGAGMTHGGGMS